MSRIIRKVKMNYFGLISFHDLNLDNTEIGMSNIPLNLTGCTRKPQMYFWSFGIERVRIRMWKRQKIINYWYSFDWYRMSLFFSKQNHLSATWLAFPLLFYKHYVILVLLLILALTSDIKTRLLRSNLTWLLL